MKTNILPLLLFLALSFIFPGIALAQTSVKKQQVPQGYKLVWADEFESSRLDTSKWRYRIGKSGTSYQRAENVSLKDGKLWIDLKKEPYKTMEYTGGGIISKFPVKYGYFEVSVKIDGGYGWHESFWTTWTSGFENQLPEYKEMPRLEIDCFEHYTKHDQHIFSYGAIQWYPLHGDVNRDFKTTEEDLTQTYNTFGFEFTPDYLNYYYNGQLLKTVDTRALPQHDQYLWLSCIANQPDAVPSGLVSFDNIRYYKISKSDYNMRKTTFIEYLDSLKGPQSSSGTDLWIEAEDFTTQGLWTKKQDLNNVVLCGVTDKDKPCNKDGLEATTHIKVKEPGTYYLWVRSRDFSASPAKRRFKVTVNGQITETEFGKHSKEGYEWEFGGTFSLPKGKISLGLLDTSQYYVRTDKLLLTTDSEFKPSGIGAPSNVKHSK
ncbi:glycoside hydrolase family 16 protein [Bacteroides oleiciplenus]|uniref:Glycoside hydrolase family 16 protein n=1 Tax=Bacteroides oleiciplenus TaxID=626931 RepID=A0A3E5BFS7_9BACE|nr:glycoside hydrolase family 16 protein [Bacteroides oleiciplenus]RGN36438.1 glycoside hydrolase family 16 protein [Bacteroides oleiciplenus]